MPSQEMTATLRTSLEQERDRLRGQLADVGATEQDLGYGENFADSGQIAAEQGENRAMANTVTDTLNDVERALEKLDAGTYGTCEVCGTDIGDPRLEAMPSTRYCIDHATGG